jgi:hypothetical protein
MRVEITMESNSLSIRIPYRQGNAAGSRKRETAGGALSSASALTPTPMHCSRNP